MVTPQARRKAVAAAVSEFGRSERRACRLLGAARSSARYKPREDRNTELRVRLRELAQKRPAFGYQRLHVLLRREGRTVNHKRVHRLYREEGLAVRRKRRKRLACGPRLDRPKPTGPNQRWSMDFIHDRLSDGRRIKTLNIVDDFTRECLAIEVGTSIPGARVARLLNEVARTRPLPKSIVSDNGPEFTGKKLDEWAHSHGVTLDFIRPGKPVENAFIESFNGKFRAECLEQHWFGTLWEARVLIQSWKRDYNQERPHSSLGNRTPKEFAEEHAIA